MSVAVLYAQHQSRFVFTSVAVDPAVSQVFRNFEHGGNKELVAGMNHFEEEVSVIRSITGPYENTEMSFKSSNCHVHSSKPCCPSSTSSRCALRHSAVCCCKRDSIC